MPQTNPFETPQASALDAADHRAMGAPGIIDVGKCFSEAWQATMSDVGLVIGVVLVGGLVAMLGYVTILGIFLILPVLGWGGVKFLLNLLDRKAQFGDLFSGFQNYGAAVGSMLLMGLCMFGLAVVGNSLYYIGIFAESSVLMGVGFLINLVWAFMVTLRFYFAPFFIVDQRMGAIDAMKASWAATGAQKLNAFLLALLSGVVAVAGLFALVIGIVISFPLAYLMWGAGYRQLSGTSRA